MADLETIAAAAGVSRRTVARILSDQGPTPVRPFAIERAKKVRRIAQEYGYRSNAAARAISTGRFNSVSFVLEGKQDTWFSPIMLLGLHDRCEERGLTLVFTRVSRSEIEREVTMPRVLREAACDGLLMHWLRNLPAGVEQHLNRHRVPYVFMNDRRDQNCIYFDDFAAAESATRHLIRLGHRKIACLMGTRKIGSHYSINDRFAGYESAMRQAGYGDATTSHVLDGFYANDDRPDFIGQLGAWLESPDRPTAVVAQGNDYATSLIAAAFSRGLRIPEDLSVICFTSSFKSPVGLLLTCMKLPDYELGERAIDMVLCRIEDPARSLDPVVLNADLVEGQTVAPVPT